MPPTLTREQSLRLSVLRELRQRLPANVRFSGDRFYVRADGVWNKTPGLRKQMERAFFRAPSSKAIQKARNAKQSKGRAKLKRNMTDSEFEELSARNRESTGIERGRQVHEEIALFCNHPNIYKKAADETANYIFETELAKNARQHPRRIQKGSNVPAYRRGIDPPRPTRVIHSYTKMIIETLKRWKLTPVVAELPIHDPAAGYATAIDLVCVSHTGKIWITEIKTGYEHTFKTATQNMKGELGKFLSNSALSQSVLQILIPMLTFRQRYGVRARGCVILVNNEGVKIQPVPDDMKNKAASLYGGIVREMQKNKK